MRGQAGHAWYDASEIRRDVNNLRKVRTSREHRREPFAGYLADMLSMRFNAVIRSQ